MTTYSLNYIIHRLRSIESDINVTEGLKIALALARNAHLLDDFESIFISSVGNSSGQSSIFMKSFIARLPKSDRKDWCTKIIGNSSKIEFAATFIDFVVMKPRFEKSLLNDDEIIDLKYKILQKLLKSTGENSHVFKDFPRMMQTLIIVWNLKDNEGLNKYLENNVFNSKIENFFEFLRVFVPVRWSSIHPEPYLGDISRDGYNNLKELVNIEKVVYKLREIIDQQSYESDLYWLGDDQNNQTDMNLGKQIIHHYEQDEQEEE